MTKRLVIFALLGAPLLAMAPAPQVVRTLCTEQPIVKGLPCHVAAASGLALEGDHFLVVIDDSLSMGVFTGTQPGRLYNLFDRPPLPLDPKDRKKLKPDLESCALVSYRGGKALLALGSGSRPNRRVGIFLPLDAQGEPQEPVPFDLSPLYKHLEKQFVDLNIEGTAALTDSGKLRLAQRGNGRQAQDALIDLDLMECVRRASLGATWCPELLEHTQPVQLGELRHVPLTFTDLSALPDGRCLFTAAAEDTTNPVRDGRILGSAVGLLSAQGTVEKLVPLSDAIKVEGVCGRAGERGIDTWMVTDADDPWRPAQLLKTVL